MSYQPEIKICGIKDPYLARDVVRMGVDYIGLIFYRQSKRFVAMDVAQKISYEVRKAGGTAVAVFVDANADEMLTICDYCNIDVVQLHGDISRANHYLLPAIYRRIYVRAVNPDGTIVDDPTKGLQYLNYERDALLFDNVQGGSGIPLPIDRFHYQGGYSYFFSGGLNPTNISAVISTLKPKAVDVSSGVEREPGVKDIALVHSFLGAIQQCQLS